MNKEKPQKQTSCDEWKCRRQRDVLMVYLNEELKMKKRAQRKGIKEFLRRLKQNLFKMFDSPTDCMEIEVIIDNLAGKSLVESKEVSK